MAWITQFGVSGQGLKGDFILDDFGKSDGVEPKNAESKKIAKSKNSSN